MSTTFFIFSDWAPTQLSPAVPVHSFLPRFSPQVAYLTGDLPILVHLHQDVAGLSPLLPGVGDAPRVQGDQIRLHREGGHMGVAVHDDVSPPAPGLGLQPVLVHTYKVAVSMGDEDMVVPNKELLLPGQVGKEIIVPAHHMYR